MTLFTIGKGSSLPLTRRASGQLFSLTNVLIIPFIDFFGREADTFDFIKEDSVGFFL